MSRSYKKTPYCKCGRSGRVGKKLANRKVRSHISQGKHIGDGGKFKRVFSSYDICDCQWRGEPWHIEKIDILNRHNRWVDKGWAEDPIDWQEEYRKYRRTYVNK